MEKELLLKRNKLYDYIVVFLLVLIPVLIAGIQRSCPLMQLIYVNERLHASLEMLGAVTAIFVAVLLTKRERLEKTDYFLPVALAFTSMGILDGFHSGFAMGNKAILLHTLASFIGSLFFASIWVPGMAKFIRRQRWFFLLSVLVACGIGLFVLAHSDGAPQVFVQSEYSKFTRNFHMVSAVFFLIAALKLTTDYQKTNDFKSFLLLCLSLLFCLAEIAFNQSRFWNVQWWFWHGVRLFAYLIVIRFVISDYQKLVDRLNRTLKDQKESQEQIKREHAQLISIFDSMDQAIYISDPETYEILYMNEAAKVLFGNAIGQKCHIVFHNTENPCAQCTNDKIFGVNLGKTYVWEDYNRHIKKWFRNIDKAIRWSDGRMVRFEMSVNIDDVKKAEEAIQQTADIKSKFISMASHELRTPLTTIQESVNVVLEGLVGDISDRQNHVLSITKTNINRLSRLVDDVLDFQKLQSGKMPFYFKEHDVTVIINNYVNNVKAHVEEKGLYIKQNYSQNLPKVFCDEDRVTQVLANLISNALKFVKKGGVVVGVKEVVGQDKLQIAVSDTGSGIRKKDMPKLFQTFEQLRASDKAVTKGTGLGLAICKEIVLGHQGKIWAESEVSKGTTFYFTLPTKQIKEEAKSKAS